MKKPPLESEGGYRGIGFSLGTCAGTSVVGWGHVGGRCGGEAALVTDLLLPNILGDPENFTPANPLITPPHIQPEWYFLFAYAILRSIPNKLGGVLALGASIFILILIPLLHTSKQRGLMFRPITQIIFWTLVSNTLILT